MIVEKQRAGIYYKRGERNFRGDGNVLYLNGVVVTWACRLVRSIRLYLRSVYIAALYFNEVTSLEKMGTVNSDNSLKHLGLEKEKRKNA